MTPGFPGVAADRAVDTFEIQTTPFGNRNPLGSLILVLPLCQNADEARFFSSAASRRIASSEARRHAHAAKCMLHLPWPLVKIARVVLSTTNQRIPT